MVHCLSDLYALTGELRYSETLNQLRSGYAGFSKTAPNGVAYALAGFTKEAIGLVMIKIREAKDNENIGVFDKIQQALSKKPYRKVFILQQKEKAGNKYQLCVGTQCMESTNDLETILEKI